MAKTSVPAWSLSALYALFLLLASSPLAAQEEISKTEVGAQIGLLGMNRFGSSFMEAGLGGRFSRNLSPSLALEAEFSAYPGDQEPPSAQNGGKTFSGFAGVKAAAIRRRRFAVSGKMRLGLVSFSNVAVQTTPTSFEIRRVTHFATELGGVFEYSLTRRWMLRSDAGVQLIQIHSRTVPVGTSGSIIAAGSLRPAFHWSAGVGYRLGELRPREDESSSEGERKWEVAGEFVSASRQRETVDTDVVTEPGLGGRLTYDFFPHLAAEAALTVFVRSESPISPLDGGRSIQALFGLKCGLRRERYGYFLRLRPGFETFTRTFASASADSGIGTEAKTNAALDLGGGMEFYVTRRTALRFDAGDTLIFVGSRTVQLSGQPVSVTGNTLSTFQFSTAFGWRF